MTFRVVVSAPVADRVRDLKINGAPVDVARTYTLALPDFVLLGGDGYEMFAGAKMLVAPEAGSLSWLMVCVRFLRTQQRVKNRCQLPRRGAWPVYLRPQWRGDGLVSGELSFG